MILDNPNNDLLKINTIKDNFNNSNKSVNSELTPKYNENLNNIIPDIKNNSSINICHNPYLINIFTKENSNNKPQLNSTQNNTSIQANKSTSNLKFINDKNNDINNNSSYENQNINKKSLNINQDKKNKEKEKIKKKFLKKLKISHIEYEKIQKENNQNKINYKLKNKRKYKADNIRKKIKARFHKSIKNIINENLRKAGSKKLFTFLPQFFINSISREKNRYILNMSLREILQKNFVNNIDEKKYKNKKLDLEKYEKNLSVLKYLDNNPEISRNSGFDIISKMKYCDLLNEYFKSEEFERAIFRLKKENEDENYIKEYIIKAKNYVKFFEEIPLKLKDEEDKKLEDDEK